MKTDGASTEPHVCGELLMMMTVILRYFFSFSGRFNRKYFWIGYGILLFPMQNLSYILRIVRERPDNLIAVIFVGLLLLLGLVACSAVATKRLHDQNLSVLWLLALYAGTLAYCLAHPGHDLTVLSGTMSLQLFPLGIARGQKGANRFGAEPT